MRQVNPHEKHRHVYVPNLRMATSMEHKGKHIHVPTKTAATWKCAFSHRQGSEPIEPNGIRVTMLAPCHGADQFVWVTQQLGVVNKQYAKIRFIHSSCGRPSSMPTAGTCQCCSWMRRGLLTFAMPNLCPMGRFLGHQTRCFIACEWFHGHVILEPI